MARDKRIDPPRPTRRELLQTAAIAGASAMCGTALASPTRQNEPQMRPYPMTNTGPNQIPQRPLGKANATISILGMGGHHLGEPKTVDEAISLVQRAHDAGITFFDNAWE